MILVMGRWSLALALVAGCFSEGTSPATDEATMHTTTGSAVTCPLGARGCPCDGLACDAGLACHGPSQMCYEPDCERGALDCPCAQGLCLPGLECIDDFCMHPSTSGESTTSTFDPDPTTDPTTTSLATTGIDPADSSGSDPTASTTGTSDDACHACLMDSAPCVCTESCESLGACIFGGTDPALCCSNGPQGHADDWNAFVACAVSEGCAGVCADPPDCGNGG